jgi:hypothetical protein
MKYPRLTFCRFMFWIAIPIAFVLEYGEHALRLSDGPNLIFQMVILLITLQWVMFWNSRLEMLEMEISSLEWEEAHRLPGNENEKSL